MTPNFVELYKVEPLSNDPAVYRQQKKAWQEKRRAEKAAQRAKPKPRTRTRTRTKPTPAPEPSPSPDATTLKKKFDDEVRAALRKLHAIRDAWLETGEVDSAAIPPGTTQMGESEQSAAAPEATATTKAATRKARATTRKAAKKLSPGVTSN